MASKMLSGIGEVVPGGRLKKSVLQRVVAAAVGCGEEGIGTRDCGGAGSGAGTDVPDKDDDERKVRWRRRRKKWIVVKNMKRKKKKKKSWNDSVRKRGHV